MKDHYVFPAIFEQEDKGISIEFPDLPGCLPCAGDLETAWRRTEKKFRNPLPLIRSRLVSIKHWFWWKHICRRSGQSSISDSSKKHCRFRPGSMQKLNTQASISLPFCRKHWWKNSAFRNKKSPLSQCVLVQRGYFFNRKRDDTKLKRKMLSQIPSPFANLIPFGRYCVSRRCRSSAARDCT